MEKEMTPAERVAEFVDHMYVAHYRDADVLLHAPNGPSLTLGDLRAALAERAALAARVAELEARSSHCLTCRCPCC